MMIFCQDIETAKKMWCPAARIAAWEPFLETQSAASFNRPFRQAMPAQRECCCIASECMAWRWVETNINNKDGDLVPSDDTHGYCGLAGKP